MATHKPQISLKHISLEDAAHTVPYFPLPVACVVQVFVDGMVYTRGSADDYNRFAAVTGDPGWSWDRLLPYFFKVRTRTFII
jgi:hypothetical protein